LNLGRLGGGDCSARLLQLALPLRSVDLSGAKFTKEGIANLANSLKVHDTIKYLGLAANKLGDEGVILIGKALQVNKSLDSLNLEKNEITERGIEHLVEGILMGRKAAFRKLSVVNNDLNNKAMNKLMLLPKLCPQFCYLDMEENGVDKVGFAYLEECLNVIQHKPRYFNFVNNCVHAEDVDERLKTMRKKFPESTILLANTNDKISLEEYPRLLRRE